DLLPTAQVWHLGLYRDHQTLKPVTYYNKLPPEPTIERALVLDPMLATGGSAVAAGDPLKRRGVERSQYPGLIAAPGGGEKLRGPHPGAPISLGAIASAPNEKGYTAPGVGAAAARQFGTG